jgi:hypothetical protein
MEQAKDPAAAPEKATVSGLRDRPPRSHALRGNVPGTLHVRLVERGKAIAGQNGYRLKKLIFTFLPASHQHGSKFLDRVNGTLKPILRFIEIGLCLKQI